MKRPSHGRRLPTHAAPSLALALATACSAAAAVPSSRCAAADFLGVAGRSWRAAAVGGRLGHRQHTGRAAAAGGAASFESGRRRDRGNAPRASRLGGVGAASRTRPAPRVASKAGSLPLMASAALTAAALLAIGVTAADASGGLYFYASRDIQSAATLGGQRVAEQSRSVLTNIPARYLKVPADGPLTEAPGPPDAPAIYELAMNWDVSKVFDSIIDSPFFDWLLDMHVLDAFLGA
mmetsp:Transcript_99632/g.260290  ORF Transcript_99632/g.260290 Transcript_99632/m.260290 type:complete len:236 (-) Transcript_99632:67-774(-)